MLKVVIWWLISVVKTVSSAELKGEEHLCGNYRQATEQERHVWEMRNGPYKERGRVQTKKKCCRAIMENSIIRNVLILVQLTIMLYVIRDFAVITGNLETRMNTSPYETGIYMYIKNQKQNQKGKTQVANINILSKNQNQKGNLPKKKKGNYWTESLRHKTKFHTTTKEKREKNEQIVQI